MSGEENITDLHESYKQSLIICEVRNENESNKQSFTISQVRIGTKLRKKKLHVLNYTVNIFL